MGQLVPLTLRECQEELAKQQMQAKALQRDKDRLVVGAVHKLNAVYP
jgi:hypothetical protein